MSSIVLLTGATGFVGRQVLQSLAARGVKVRVLVREGKRAEIAKTTNIEAIVTTNDMFAESPEWWLNVCRGIDTIVHVAWYAEPGKYLYSEKNLDCLIGTLQLANAAALARVRRFVGIGTCFEYDLANGLLRIQTPLCPTTPYAAAKAAAYMALSKWLPLYEIEFAWCRLFYIYGDGEDKRRLVPYLHAQLSAGQAAELTTGKQIRDYLDVREVGQQIASVALGSEIGPMNICSGVPITVRQLAEQIADLYGRRDLLKFGVRPDNLVDPVCVVGIKS